MSCVGLGAPVSNLRWKPIRRRCLQIAYVIAAAATPLAAQQVTYVAMVKGPGAAVRGSTQIMSDGIAAGSGSQIDAGAHNAQLALTRGGALLLCRDSSLTLDGRGSQLLMALQAGSFEARYAVPAAGDHLITSDYQLNIASLGHTSGELADYRVGISSSGDMLVQVLPESDAAVKVASSFGPAETTVRPGEIRGFPALGSRLSPEQVVQTVSVRCPVEVPPAQQTLTASKEGTKSEPAPSSISTVEQEQARIEPPPDVKGQLSVPLAFEPPPLPPATATAQPQAQPTTPAAPEPAASVASAPQPTQPETAQVAPTPAIAAAPKPKHENVFASIGHFFRRLFGGGQRPPAEGLKGE